MSNNKEKIYHLSEIPNYDIDYRGLIKYAKGKGKKVVDLSDAEKELFTNGVSMKELRANMLT